jgi:acetyl-CoA carboxylase carboxyl transferase subunit alpha
MPHPEGYRKALRLMKMAEKFGRPVVTLIDTPGAYPGAGRGGARPGGGDRAQPARDGGAAGADGGGGDRRGRLRRRAGDRRRGPGADAGEQRLLGDLARGCAAILWKSGAEREKAATALKLTAQDLHGLGVIDEVIPEPAGGAHSDWERTAAALREALAAPPRELRELPVEELLAPAGEKYLAMGEWRGP